MFLCSDNREYLDYWLYWTALTIVSLIILLDSDFSHAQTTPQKNIVGAWEVYKDDDNPGKDIPKEIMNFWNDGEFTISGKSTHIGLYRVNGNKLQLLVKVGDEAMLVERTFQVSEHELKFKNEENGWVYYKRVNDKPLGNPPDL